MAERAKRVILTTAPAEYLVNKSDAVINVKNIIICNTNEQQTCKLYLLARANAPADKFGAIFYGLEIEPSETKVIEDLKINQLESLYAWSNIGGSISININIT
jgi:hypothetical protein